MAVLETDESGRPGRRASRGLAWLAASLLLGVACHAEPETRVPYEVSFGSTWLEVEIEGRGPYHVALDTGAPLTVLDERVAAELGLRVRDLGTIVAAGSEPVRQGLARDVTLELGGREVRFDRVQVLPLHERLGRFVGRPFHGLIGNELTRRLRLELDPERRELVLQPAGRGARGEPAGSVRLTGEHWSFARAVLVTPDGRRLRGRFLVDTFAAEETALFVGRRYAEEHGLFALAEGVPEDLTVGLSGPVRFQAARLAALEVGTLRIEAPTVALSRDVQGLMAGEEFDGVLATGLLARFGLVFEDRGERLTFRETARSSAPFGFGTSGLLPAFTDESLETLHVEAVTAGSPAALAGLREGDVLLQPDGEATAGASFVRLLERLRRPNETLRLRIRRGSEEREASFTTGAIPALELP